MTLRYTDIDPNVIELISQKLQSPLEKLIEEKIQRRQQWGPTFKQEDIAELTMTDADFVVPAPEYGKRVLRMGGAGLTAPRVLRVPPIPSAWWIIHNRTSQPLQVLTDPTGTVGPTLPPDQVGGVYTDGIGVWQFACCGGAEAPGGEDMPPGGGGTNIQYRLSATTFGGVGGSSTSGAAAEHVHWEGWHQINKAGNRSYEWFIDPGITTGTAGTLTEGANNRTYMLGQRFSDNPSDGVLIDFLRGRGSYTSPADVSGGDIVGGIRFRCMMSGVPMLCGGIESSHDGDGGAVAIGHVEGSFSANGDQSIGLYQGPSDARSFEIGNTGFKFSHGVNNSTFYQDATGFFVPVPAGTAGQVLTLVGGVPGWATVAGASFPSLNQVTDPTAAKTFLMGNHTLGFSFTAADTNEDCFAIEGVDSAAGTGSILMVRSGASSTKAPFRVGVGGAAGPTIFAVSSNGKVGVGGSGILAPFTPAYDLNVWGSVRIISDIFSTPPGSAVIISQTSNSANGETALDVQAVQTGNFTGIGLLNDVSFFSDVQVTGTLGDIRGVTHSMSYSGTLGEARLRGFVAQMTGISQIGATSHYTAFFAATGATGVAGGHPGTYRGLYIQTPLATWGKYYGVITEAVFLSGFGTAAPTATLHTVGTAKFDLGSDGLGDIYYRAASGLFTALHNSGSSWDGRVLTLSSGIPVWATPSGGPGSTIPGGDPGNLQYNIADTSFEGITQTSFGSVDGIPTLGMSSNRITFGTKDSTSYISVKAITTSSTQILMQAGHVSQRPELVFQASRAGLANLNSGDTVGQIRWEAMVGGVPDTVQGSIYGFYSATNGGTIRVMSGTASSRLEVLQRTVKITALDTTNWTYEYTNIGPRWLSNTSTHGVRGALYYVGAGAAFDHLKALPISTTAGQVLGTAEVGGAGSGIWEPQWITPSGGPGGGIASTGGNTNSIQYRSGAGTTTLGGVNTAVGVLIASAANGLASFATTLPATRFWFSPGTTAGLNVGQGFSQPTSLNSVDGDIFYDSSLGKFRVRENGQWWDMRGAASLGGGTYAIQYNTGSGLGGITPALGVFAAGSSAEVAQFSPFFPTTRMTFQMGSTAGLNVGTGISDPASGSSTNGDVYYNAVTHKFRGRQNSTWIDLGGGTGSVSPPVSWTHSAASNSPILFTDHTQTASGVANVYGQFHWFRHNDPNTVSDGRRGFAFAMQQQAGGTGATNGDVVIEIYYTNAVAMTLSNYHLTGFLIGGFANSQLGTFTAIRIESMNASKRRAICIERDAGDLMLNAPTQTTNGAEAAGTAMPQGQTWGFLYIPAMDGAPTAGSINSLVPIGTCALVWDRTNNRLFANDGDGWKSTPAFT